MRTVSHHTRTVFSPEENGLLNQTSSSWSQCSSVGRQFSSGWSQFSSDSRQSLIRQEETVEHSGAIASHENLFKKRENWKNCHRQECIGIMSTRTVLPLRVSLQVHRAIQDHASLVSYCWYWLQHVCQRNGGASQHNFLLHECILSVQKRSTHT